jgi:hypothetical protein
LGDLASSKLVFMAIPEATAACCLGVVIDAVPTESTSVRIGDLGLKNLDVPWKILAINASLARLGLNEEESFYKHHSSFPNSCSHPSGDVPEIINSRSSALRCGKAF